MFFTESKKSLLVKVLSFLLHHKKLNYSDYLIDFDCFYRSIANLKVLYGDNLDFKKAKIGDVALLYFCSYNTNVAQHLSSKKFEAL